MAMPLVVPRYTLRDLDSFPDDGSRYELLDGVLLVTPAPVPLHQLVIYRLGKALTEYVSPGDLARVFTPGAVEVGNGDRQCDDGRVQSVERHSD